MLLVAALLAMSPPTPREMPAEVVHLVHAGDVELPIHLAGGSGPGATTLIGLHGGPSLGAQYLFDALRPLASPSLRVAVFDQRGSARVTPKAPGAPKAYSPEKYADDLAAVIEALRVDRAHLLAHSWGGLTAYAFAQRNAGRIASLVLVDAVAPTWTTLLRGGAARRERVRQLQAEGLVAAPLPTLAENCLEARRALTLATIADPKHPPADVLKPLPGNCSIETVAAITAQAEGYDYRAALARLNIPVLLVFGAQDPLDAGTADETQAALSGARVRRVSIAASGHYPFFEQPAAFFSELRAFLEARE
jgi:proline iminopeptidase